MARHGFGRGEYKYFAYPAAGPRRRAAHGALSAARADRQSLERAMGVDVRYPTAPRRFHRTLPCAPGRPGRPRLLLQYRPDDLQLPASGSLRRARLSACKPCSCCPQPGAEFTGGELVLTEQRPRMQSRVEVVPLATRRRRRSSPCISGRGADRAATIASRCGTVRAGSGRAVAIRPASFFTTPSSRRCARRTERSGRYRGLFGLLGSGDARPQ